MDMLRPYTRSDRDACLQIFDSNTPRYFALAEREQFARFLLAPVGTYCVVERDGEVLACGGYLILSDPAVAELTWGMVSADNHGDGLGRFLTVARLNAMRALPGVCMAYINTSQKVQGFYERLGFATLRMTCDKHGPGIHSVEMQLALNMTDAVRSSDQQCK